MTETSQSGIVSLQSTKSVGEVLLRLLSILKDKNIILFAVVDHSGEAEKVGLRMPETKLVIFGRPEAGTPVMLAAPDIAIDLPLKILIAASPSGGTRVSYNDPLFLQRRYGLPEELLGRIAAVKDLAAAAVA